MTLLRTLAVSVIVAFAPSPVRAAITPIARLPRDMAVLARHPSALMPLIDDLKLSTAQRARMTQIIHDGMKKDPTVNTLGATPTQMSVHAQLLGVLTPAQRTHYDALIERIAKTPAQILMGAP